MDARNSTVEVQCLRARCYALENLLLRLFMQQQHEIEAYASSPHEYVSGEADDEKSVSSEEGEDIIENLERELPEQIIVTGRGSPKRKAGSELNSVELAAKFKVGTIYQITVTTGNRLASYFARIVKIAKKRISLLPVMIKTDQSGQIVVENRHPKRSVVPESIGPEWDTKTTSENLKAPSADA
jgi:hypothetical protein